MKDVITMKEFKNNDDVITHILCNDVIIGSFAATPKNIGESLWGVEVAFWEGSQISIIDAFKSIEGNYSSYLKNYIDKLLWVLVIAHKSDKSFSDKVEKLDKTLYERRDAFLHNSKKRYFNISKTKEEGGIKFYNVELKE